MGNKIKIKKKPSGRRPTNSSGSATRPLGKWVATAAGFLVVAAIVGVIAFSPEPLTGVPDGTETVAVDAPQHVEGEIHEEGEVPAGGEHNPIWLNCGYYDTEVRSENAVHSLEHGAVWITYKPGLAESQLKKLGSFTGGFDKVLVSPVAGQDSPIIVTAWANQLRLTDANDARLAQFVAEFEGLADELASYLGSGFGQTNFVADTQFSVSTLADTIVFTTWSQRRSDDPARAEAARPYGRSSRWPRHPPPPRQTAAPAPDRSRSARSSQAGR